MRWNRTGLRAWIAVLAVMGLGATLARPGAVAAQPQGTESCRLDPFDLTDDGYISRADADLWQQYFAAGDLRADLNGDGKLERAEGPSILKEMIKPDCKLLAIKAKGQGSIEVGGHYADAASESLYWTKPFLANTEPASADMVDSLDAPNTAGTLWDNGPTSGVNGLTSERRHHGHQRPGG